MLDSRTVDRSAVYLEILLAMWALPRDATALERLLVWRPTTGDGWRFRAEKLRELGHPSPPSS